jgi:hypothetical protein
VHDAGTQEGRGNVKLSIAASTAPPKSEASAG